WFAILDKLQSVERKKLLNVDEHCVRASDVAEGQILRQYALVELSLHPEICQDGLDLRAEEKCFAVPVVVERFDTEAIASHKEAPLSRIPNGKKIGRAASREAKHG